MELFKITCLTCRARLSVRDAALVGQIIGCPRCGMMVEVTPPANSAPVAAASAVAAAAPVLATPEPHKPVEVFAAADDLASPPAVSENAEATSSIFDDDQHLATINDSAPPAPPEVPSSAAAVSGLSGYKFAALLVAATITGATVVGGTIAWLRDDPITAAATNVEQATSDPPSPEAAVAEVSPQVDPTQEVKPTAVEDANPTESEAFLPIGAPNEETLEVQSPEGDTAAAATDLPLTEADESQPVATPENESTGIATNAAPIEPEAPPRLRIDPLDVDPEGLDLTTLFAGPQKDPLAESQLPVEQEPASSIPANEPADAPAEAPPAAPEAVRRDEQAGAGAPAAVEALLARRLPAVSVAKAPLCRFLDLAVQLSGLPVSVDPNELRMAAVTAATPVSVDVTDATIEQLLTTALQPLRLKPIVEDEHIRLVRSGDDARRTVEYPVDDLAKTPEQVKQLGGWITQLAAPTAWSPSGGEATLVADGAELQVDAPTSVQYQVLFVLERYRLARGLPVRTKYPRNLLAAEPAHAAVAERLSAPAQFTFSHYTPLREAFRFWQEELEVAVLVDWQALAGERLWPQSRIACSAADKPWAEAMDSVLQPLGLAWRAVDRRTIEITTLAKVNSEPQFEIYYVRPGVSLDGSQLAERIHALDASQETQAAAVLYDDSRILLTRQPAAVHRRIVGELSDLLEFNAGDDDAP